MASLGLFFRLVQCAINRKRYASLRLESVGVGSWMTGNVDRLLFVGNGNVATMHKKWAFRTDVSYQYGTFSKKVTENDLFTRLFFYLYPKNKIYPYLMCWGETSKRRALEYRLQIGPGATWVVYKKALAYHKSFADGDF